MNSIGHIFRFTSYGESHGKAIGGVIDGMPSGIEIDMEFIEAELRKRKPSSTYASSSRQETDNVEILSGIYEGKTIGSPIAFLIKNRDSRSSDYTILENAYRASHADDVYKSKYGFIDFRGGGRASARETAARVVAGAFAKIILKKYDIKIYSYTNQIGKVVCDTGYCNLDLEKIYESELRCPEVEVEKAMKAEVDECMKTGDTLGGSVFTVVKGLSKGLGEPIFYKLTSALASGMMSIPSSRGFEIGQGFKASSMRGSEHNDKWRGKDNRGVLITEENICGGVRGGISTGEELYFRVGFKPISTLSQAISVWDESKGKKEIEIKGRHDICAVPRAVAVVESMTAIILLDMILLSNSKGQNKG